MIGVMELRHEDDAGNPTGRSSKLTNVNFKPNTFAELKDIPFRTKPVTLAIKWTHTSIEDTHENAPEYLNSHAGQGRLTSKKTMGAVALVPGGWLPPAFAAEKDQIFLLDYSTQRAVADLFAGGEYKSPDSKGDFLDVLLGDDVKINSTFRALEGNLRRPPTKDEITQQLDQANSDLQAALPKAILTPSHSLIVEGIFGQVQDSAVALQRKTDLLLAVAPLLRSAIAKARRSKVWDQVLELADRNDISRYSLLVVSLLTMVSSYKEASPAAKVFKFRDIYGPGHAYNALCDLRILEMYLCAMALFPEQNQALLTTDKNLALLWSGLLLQDPVFEGEILEYRLSPVAELFPDMTDNMKAYFKASEGKARLERVALPKHSENHASIRQDLSVKDKAKRKAKNTKQKMARRANRSRL